MPPLVEKWIASRSLSSGSATRRPGGSQWWLAMTALSWAWHEARGYQRGSVCGFRSALRFLGLFLGLLFLRCFLRRLLGLLCRLLGGFLRRLLGLGCFLLLVR